MIMNRSFSQFKVARNSFFGAQIVLQPEGIFCYHRPITGVAYKPGGAGGDDYKRDFTVYTCDLIFRPCKPNPLRA